MNCYRLGSWVLSQRQNKGKLSADRRERLDTLGFDWNPLEVGWEEGFAYLTHYKNREGHCRVRTEHKEDGFSLGQWVRAQRARKNKLSDQRRRRLDDLGFEWHPYETSWDEGYTHLKLYRKREGHARVPYLYQEKGFRLGGWVNKQRTKQNKLSEAQRKRLDELGFVWKVR
jgi:hypothetical protein